MSSGIRHIGFPISEDRYDIIREYCFRRKITIAGFVRSLIDGFFDFDNEAMGLPEPTREQQFNPPRQKIIPQGFHERVEKDIAKQQPVISPRVSDFDINFIATTPPPEEQHRIEQSVIQGAASRFNPTSGTTPIDTLFKQAHAVNEPKPPPAPRPAHKRSDVI